jgi:hypothetical protein
MSSTRTLVTLRDTLPPKLLRGQMGVAAVMEDTEATA